ncbi:MAG: hypothetical protein KI790_05220 [Cyclobacteriaceae bacterium]|nr:hypothetical protein [Cyclobacteriaceae bacterium HetDA_MAG_MS6]
MRSFQVYMFVAIATLLGCRNSDDDPSIPLEREENEFIWKGLNSWYFWQEEVQDLADDRFGNETEFRTFLNEYSDPSDLFRQLRSSSDRFSWIVDNYIELDNSFQGISKSFGYEFGLVGIEDDKFFGYVRYVVDGSPAAQSGLKRGDIFTEVNGVQLEAANYRSLLFGLESYDLTLARFENESLVNTGRTGTLTAVEITENPVLLAKTFEMGGTKIGYLVYNGFTHTFHSQLNQAIGTLKSQGATELILDLRYNGGGSVYTAMHLATMLYDKGAPNDIFGEFVYNPKKSNLNAKLGFVEAVDVLDGDFTTIGTEAINRLSLTRLYVITSGNTASASELIINGLRPYMEVRLVGTTTVGKNEGSVTLYDSPGSDYRNRSTANSNHLWAMQPIVSRVANSEGFSDYSSGFSPQVEISELDFVQNLKAFGDPEEPLLGAALADITGIPFSGRKEGGLSLQIKLIGSSQERLPLSTEMHLNGLIF